MEVKRSTRGGAPGVTLDGAGQVAWQSRSPLCPHFACVFLICTERHFLLFQGNWDPTSPRQPLPEPSLYGAGHPLSPYSRAPGDRHSLSPAGLSGAPQPS